MRKIKKLKSILKSFKKVVIAFSGGVDSSFLLKIASSVLPKKDILAVTAVSDTYTSEELKKAKKFTKLLGVKHKVSFTKELNDKNFRKNTPKRCYYCKKELFKELKRIAKKNRFKFILDASNADDKKDYRPGSIAKKEFNVKSPLQAAGMNKKDIRGYSKKLNLDTWNLPSMACLASRIPYGEEVKKSTLIRIRKAEEVIKRTGIKEVRVRSHKDLARIEVSKKEIKRFYNQKFCDRIIKSLKSLGFCYIVLDLEGYRTGSLNEVLK